MVFILVFIFHFHKSDTKFWGGFEKYSDAHPFENEKEKLKPKQKHPTKHPTKYQTNFWSTRPGGAVLSPSGGEGRGFHENWLKFFCIGFEKYSVAHLSENEKEKLKPK
jgi:hypothetical protein